LAEHALSAHFAFEIAAPWNARGSLVRRARGARRGPSPSSVRWESLRKKAFPQRRCEKYCLPKRAHVLFSAPILFARRDAAHDVTNQNSRGVPQMAKKGGAPTKSEVLTHISKETGLSRKQVGGVFDSLSGVIKKSLRGGGLFTLPGLLKMKVVKKPATKAREGVNPFTGEKMMFKAKPASKKVRCLPLKSLKGMVN
jgi:DNA-binding protein HU-beta